MDSICTWAKENKKLLCFIGTTAAVYLVFRYMLPLFAPFVIAALLAWLIRPLTELLKKRIHIPYLIGGLISLLLFLTSFSVIIFYLGRIFIDEGVRFISRIPQYLEMLGERVQGICRICDSIFGMAEGSAQLAVDDGVEAFTTYLTDSFLPELTGHTLNLAIGVAGVIGTVFLVLIAALLIVKEMCEYSDGKRKNGIYPWVKKLMRKLSEAGTAYMRVQLTIMLIIAVVCCTGLFIMGNEYALITGISIALIDALPVLGSGMILVPWSVIMFFSHDYKSGIILAVIFILCSVIRELIEPKLLGNKMGLRPIYALMAIFVGYRLFGVIGFILGPYGLLLIKTIVSS